MTDPRGRHRRWATAIGLAAGFVLDRLVADPQRLHPVAGLGRAIAVTEHLLYADSRMRGTIFTAVWVAAGATAGTCAQRVAMRGSSPIPLLVLTAATTWTVLGGTSLVRVGDEVADALAAGDIGAARATIPSLCGRDPESLDAAGICRAAVESIAENTSDATVAPLLWGAVAGVPGLLVYRTINTLDAMVGYRNERYRRFGWASARLDDAANLIPARVTGVLTAAMGSRSRAALGSWRRYARRHPSPNAGVVESAFAGALGLRLGGRTVYPHGVEERPVLGRGRPPGVVELRAAATLSERVQAAAVPVAVAVVAGSILGVSRRSVR
ncbi:cobalamin biosynthesis protein [Gordonia sp. NPDC003425]